MTEKPKTFRKVRKELAAKMAGEPLEVDRSELDTAGRRIWCSAEGCPMRASTYFGSALCSWHDKADSHDWPRVTAELVETRAGGGVPARPPIRPAALVREAVAKVKAYLAGREQPQNAFAALSARVSRVKAQREAIKGMGDDDVNAMLQEAAR